MLPLLLSALLTVVSSGESDVVFCGGFIKSPTALPFSQASLISLSFLARPNQLIKYQHVYCLYQNSINVFHDQFVDCSGSVETLINPIC